MTPEIGITGTPVIDLSNLPCSWSPRPKKQIWSHTLTTFYQTLHELDLRTGIDRAIPRRITAMRSGSGPDRWPECHTSIPWSKDSAPRC